MSRSQFRFIKTGTGQLQPNIGIYSGLLGLAEDPSMEKQKSAKPRPSPINRGRGRIGRLLGPRKLQKLGVACREAKSVNDNPTKRKRGRPWGSGKCQILRAQLEQQFEVAKSARLVQPTAEPHLPAGTWFWNVTSSGVLRDVPLRMCSSAQLVSINSPTESSAVPSTCTEPLSGGNGVIRTHGEKGEKPGASQEPKRMNHHPLPGGGQCSNGANYGDITKSFNMSSGVLVQNYSGSCLNSEDMSRAQLPYLEMGTGQLQPNFELVSGLLAVDPSMEKQKLSRSMPNRINRGRDRISRFCGPRNLQYLEVAYREAKSVRNNLPKRGRGRPRGTGRRQILRAQLEQQLEVLNSAILVQPTETHLLAGTCMVSEKEEMMPSGAPLRRCSSAQLNLINSPTKSSAVPSTCTEPLSGDNGVISKHGAKAQLEQLSEVRNSAVLVQPTAEPHLLAGTCMANEKEKMMPVGAPLRRCSSAQFILINSSTESSAVPSTCTEPLSGDNGVINKHGAKGETPGASQEHSRINPEPLPGGDQCSNEAKNNKKWDTASLMKAIIKKHGDITKSCIFQSQLFKTNCLIGISRIVKSLLETRLADVNPGLLKELYSFIEDAESVNLDVKWLRKHVNEVKEAMSSSATELERLEQAERELRQQNEERKKAINVKRVEVAKLQSEIEVQEEELALGILSSKDLKAQISCIKSRYNSSDYVKESLI